MVEKKKQSTSESRHVLGVHPTGHRASGRIVFHSGRDSSATLKVTRLFHQDKNDKTKPKTCYTRSVHTKET